MKLKLATIALFTFLWASARAQDASTPPPAPETPDLSRPALDLVGLAETGAAEDAQINFINQSSGAFNLSADGIFYLRDQGISSTVLTAMINHDKGGTTTPPAADQSAQTYNYNQQVYPATVPPPTMDNNQPQPGDQPQPAMDQSQTPPPTYDSSTAPPDVSYFYDNLQPYGSWMVVNGDWCWQPRACLLDHTWRPYCHGGHWVYSSADWCWQSDYSWGWAPFHYGRWDIRPGVGWVWLPGRDWSPGWVTWRTEGDVCGWAPLPWHSEFVAGAGYRFNGARVGVDFNFGLGVGAFTFISVGNFGAHDYFHRALPPVEAQRAFARATIINNYEVGGDHIVRNRGVPLERVEAATHTTFRPVPIRAEAGGAPVHGVTPGVIYRHELVAPAARHDFVAQKIDPQHPTVYHTSIARPAPEVHQTAPNRANVTPQNNYRSTPATQPAPHPNNQTPRTYNNSTIVPRSPQASTTTTPPARVQTARTYTPTPAPAPAPVVKATPAPAETSSRYTSMNGLVQRQGTPVQTYTPQPASHVYYPKTYEQANENTSHSTSISSTSSTHSVSTSTTTHSTSPAPKSTPAGPSQPHGQNNNQGR